MFHSTNIPTEEIEEWNEVLQKINYLNWSFKIIPNYGMIVLHVDAKVKNSNPPHEDTIVHHSTTIPYSYFQGRNKTSRKWKVKQIFRYICHIQIHEASEFFKVENEAPFHAHNSNSEYHKFEYPIIQYPDHDD